MEAGGQQGEGRAEALPAAVQDHPQGLGEEGVGRLGHGPDRGVRGHEVVGDGGEEGLRRRGRGHATRSRGHRAGVRKRAAALAVVARATSAGRSSRAPARAAATADDVGRLVALPPVAGGAEVGAVRLHHQALQGDGGQGAGQGEVAPVGQGAGGGEVEAQRDRPPGVFGVPVEAVQHAPRREAGAGQRVQRLRHGLPGVDDHREIEGGGELQLGCEGAGLDVPGGEVAVEVQPALPDGHHPRPAGQTLHLSQGLRGGEAGVVGVDAHRRPDVFVARGQLHRGPAGGEIVAGDDDPSHAGCPGPFQHGVQVTREAPVREVGVGVDEGPGGVQRCERRLARRGWRGSLHSPEDTKRAYSGPASPAGRHRRGHPYSSSRRRLTRLAWDCSSRRRGRSIMRATRGPRPGGSSKLMA